MDIINSMHFSTFVKVVLYYAFFENPDQRNVSFGE